MNNRFGLELQMLTRVQDRVLVVADLLRRRSADERFTAREIDAAFLELNVPPPGNTHQTLANLATAQTAIRHSDRRWALTPCGVEAASKVGTAAPSPNVANGLDTAQFAHTDHTVIPAWAAPPRWKAGIARLLERHPFDDNVLCMTRFPSEGGTPDPVRDAIERAKQVLKPFGLILHLASDSIVEEDLMGNVGAYMWACRYGLGFVEDRVQRGLNYNAVIELGGMALTGRRCAILKDVTSPPLPTDLAGQIYKGVDLDDLDHLARVVSAWVENDLHRRKA